MLRSAFSVSSTWGGNRALLEFQVCAGVVVFAQLGERISTQGTSPAQLVQERCAKLNHIKILHTQ